MSQRIYSVTTPEGKIRLVRASVKQQALAHVAKSTFTVSVASQDELIKAITAGAKVEDFAAEPEAAPVIQAVA